MTATCAVMGGILKILILILFEILAVYLVDRLFYVSVVVTSDKYKWKICHSEPRNLTNWPTESRKFGMENCGPYPLVR